MGFAFGAATWPLAIHFRAQLVYIYAAFIIVSAVIGWLHHEPASFALFTASVLAIPFWHWSETRTGWVERGQEIRRRPERQLQSPIRRERQGPHLAWTAQENVSLQAHPIAA